MEKVKVVNNKTKLKVNDNVVVVSGADRGKRGKILKIDANSSRVIVEGINKKTKYLRATQENPQGGMVNIEFPIHISNVMLFCEKSKKPTRVGIEITDKSKNRISKKSGKSIDK